MATAAIATIVSCITYLPTDSQMSGRHVAALLKNEADKTIVRVLFRVLRVLWRENWQDSIFRSCIQYKDGGKLYASDP